MNLKRSRACRAMMTALAALALAGCGISIAVPTPASSGAKITPAPALPSVTPLAAPAATAPAPTVVVLATPGAPATAPAPTSTQTPKPAATAIPAKIDGLKTVTLDKLPPEAQTTARLILKGGPFPYDRDGVVYQNRERNLPIKPSGYYHEYTVVTPGSADRGARRIVAGSNGELYYTSDHYATFMRIVLP